MVVIGRNTLASGERRELQHATAAMELRSGIQGGEWFSNRSNSPHRGTIPLNSRIFILIEGQKETLNNATLM